MPIIFVSLNKKFINKVNELGFIGKLIKIQNYKLSNKKTFYVSPANSLCFMDGGIDYALSRIIFPNVQSSVVNIVKNLKIYNKLGRTYLPIGSSIILDFKNTALVVAPTMLLPQKVSNTKNAYYATMAVLYNVLINQKYNLNNVDIIFTSMCCGYGEMNEYESLKQILEGIRDYKNYNPHIVNNSIIIKEPNLTNQPKYYQNTEFFDIAEKDIIKC